MSKKHLLEFDSVPRVLSPFVNEAYQVFFLSYYRLHLLFFGFPFFGPSDAEKITKTNSDYFKYLFLHLYSNGQGTSRSLQARTLYENIQFFKENGFYPEQTHLFNYPGLRNTLIQGAEQTRENYIQYFKQNYKRFFLRYLQLVKTPTVEGIGIHNHQVLSLAQAEKLWEKIIYGDRGGNDPFETIAANTAMLQPLLGNPKDFPNTLNHPTQWFGVFKLCNFYMENSPKFTGELAIRPWPSLNQYLPDTLYIRPKDLIQILHKEGKPVLRNSSITVEKTFGLQPKKNVKYSVLIKKPFDHLMPQDCNQTLPYPDLDFI